MLELGGRLRLDAGAGALADRPWVVGVATRGQHGGEAGDVCQGLGVVLASHAGGLDTHAAQQRPVAWHDTHWESFLGRTLLLALFGSSVLKPNLLRQRIVGNVKKSKTCESQEEPRT